MMSRISSLFHRMLAKRPLLTNTTIYATFYTGAELSQQTFNKFYTPEKPDYDVVYGARVVTVGTLTYAPILYFWYKYLDRKFAGKAIKNVLIKVAADQFLMTPILMAVFFTVLGTLERGKEDMFGELKDKYVTALCANQLFWLPGQTINFAIISPAFRVIYVSAASFIWINVLCFIKRQKSEKVSQSD